MSEVYALFQVVQGWGGSHELRLIDLYETPEKAQAAAPIPDDYTWRGGETDWSSCPGQQYVIEKRIVK